MGSISHRGHRGDGGRKQDGRDKLNMNEIIYGRQPVIETMKAGRRKIFELYILQSAKPSDDLHEVVSMATNSKALIREVDRKYLDKLTGGTNHQGVAVSVANYPYIELKQLIDQIQAKKNPPFLLVLDHVQDPQNLGSLLRSADAAGVDAIIIPKDRAVGVTPAVVRASAGASEHVQVCLVTNLVQTMKQLKEHELWFTGLEALPEAKIYTEADFTGAVGLVVGSEGEGLGRLVRETCDFLVKIPLHGKVSSLNAGAAGAIALFEIRRQMTKQ